MEDPATCEATGRMDGLANDISELQRSLPVAVEASLEKRLPPAMIAFEEKVQPASSGSVRDDGESQVSLGYYEGMRW